MSAWFLTCLVVVPVLAAGERFLFGNCSDYEDKTDPISQTEDGLSMLKKLGQDPGLSMILWDPSSREIGNRCMRLKFDLVRGSYEFSFIDSTGARSHARGSAHFTMTPRTLLQLSGNSDEGGLTKNVFSARLSGISELFPLHISHKELLLLGCSPVFGGKFETLYVLTKEDVSDLSIECSRATISAATGRPVMAASNDCGDSE